MLAFIFGGVLLAVIDWKVQRLPTRLVYLTLAGVGAGLVFASLVEWDWVPLATAVAGAAAVRQRLLPHLVRHDQVRRDDGARLRRRPTGRGARAAARLVRPAVRAVRRHRRPLLAVVVAVATCIHQRKLHLRYSFGPPLIAGTLAVVLLHA